MTTPTEQVFLFGRVVDTEPPPGISFMILADLTAESAIVIATMTLLALTLGFWDTFICLTNPVLLSIARILQNILAFLKKLLTIRSLHELRTHIHWDRVVSIVASLNTSRGGHLLRCIWRWYWPDNKPIHTICRLLPTLVVLHAVYESSLRPVYWYVCGFLDGLIVPDAVQSVYCMDAITRLRHNHRMSPRKWMQSQYCIGQEDGLDIRSTYDGYFWYNDIIHTEVNSVRLLAYMGILLCIVIHIGLAGCAVSKTADSQQLFGLFQCNKDTSIKSTTSEREVELWGAVRLYEAQATTMKQLILTKNEELREANRHIEQAHCEIRKLSSQAISTRVSPTQPPESTAVAQLRREIATKDIQLQELRGHITSQGTRLSSRERAMTQLVSRLQKEAAEKDQVISQAQDKMKSNDAARKTLTDRVACLEKQLADGKRHEATLEAKLDARRMEAEAQKSPMTKITERLADAEAQMKRQQEETVPLRDLPNRTNLTGPTPSEESVTERHQALMTQHKGLSKQHDDLITRFQQLAFQNRNLAANNEEMTRDRDELRSTGGQVAEQLRNVLAGREQELNTAREQVARSQQEMQTIRVQAEMELQMLKQSLDMAQAHEAGLKSVTEDLKTTYNRTLEQQRLEKDQQLDMLRAEVNDLQTRMGLALRDAQRSHEQATEAVKTNTVLQHRLSKWEKSDSLQEIPKRSTGNSGSVATALAQTKVTVCQQAAEIQRLQQAIRELRGSRSQTDSQMDSGWQEKYEAMRQALETEQRAHKEAVVNWGKRNKDLAEELQKARVSLSNAKAMSGGNPALRSPKRT